MSFLKSIAMVGMGFFGVAAFMAAAVLCPFVFLKLSCQDIEPGDESALDGKLNIHPRSGESLTPYPAALMTVA